MHVAVKYERTGVQGAGAVGGLGAERGGEEKRSSYKLGLRMSSSRPKIAAVVTTYFKYSHAQHIVDRFLDGYGWNGAHHYPPMDLVSLYVDQVGANDLSRERAARHPE